MKRIQTILFLLVLLLPGCKAVQDIKEPQEKQGIVPTSQKVRVTSMGFYGKTNDVLLWYGVEYMMSESPLSGCKDYKTLFGTHISNPSDPTSPIESDKNYKAKWIVMDRNLYLYDIEILDGAEKYPNKRKMLEKLTHQTFQQELHILPEYPDGVLFASWFSDTLYLKRFPAPGESYCDPIYRCETFKMFIFKEGRLVRDGMALSTRHFVDSLEIENNPTKYRKNKFPRNRFGYEWLDPCTIHLTENLTEEQYLWDSFFSETSDEIMWNDTAFMCGESPLSVFENYKKIYPNMPFIEIESSLPQFHEKNYIAKWVIDNDRLYLYDIVSGRKRIKYI